MVPVELEEVAELKEILVIDSGHFFVVDHCLYKSIDLIGHELHLALGETFDESITWQLTDFVLVYRVQRFLQSSNIVWIDPLTQI